MKQIDSAAYSKTHGIMKELFPILSDNGILILIRNAMLRPESELAPLEIVALLLYSHYEKVSK